MKSAYEKGLVEVGAGLWAYLQPDGSWGLNNAGLIEAEGEALLVDTLFDLAHTREMLDAMRKAAPSAERIGTVVNTHANGDHCWGNALVKGARIVSSKRSADEMEELPPARVALLLKAARLVGKLGLAGRGLGKAAGALGLSKVAHLVEAAPFVERIFGRFEFDGIELVPPDTTFEGSFELRVGGRKVELVEVGPAHTKGDVLVFVDDGRAAFTGDILFIDAHPIVWQGPLSNWVEATDRILARGPEVIVPGHGRLASADDVRQVRDYLKHVEVEATKRHAAGMPPLEAAMDIAFDEFSSWSEAERVAVNVDTVYRHLDGHKEPGDVVELFAKMALVARKAKRR